MYLIDSVKKIIHEGEYKTLYDEVLLKINTLRWKKKYQTFNDYYSNHQWEQAITASEKTLEKGVADGEFHRKLANAYIHLNSQEKATAHMQKAFSLNSLTDVQSIIAWIEETTFPEHKTIHSQFTYLGGADNLGFIEHTIGTGKGTRKYLTKIVPTTYPLDHFAKKEQYFHIKVRPKYPSLQELTLDLIGDAEIKAAELLLMTFPKLANDGISRENIPTFIQLTKKINAAIPAYEISRILEVTDKGKAPQLSALMHKASTHRIIFRKIRSKIKTLDERDILEQVVAQMEQLILGLALYKEIDLATDYVFCHGDLNESNVLYNEKETSYVVIDWSSFRLGLRGYDLAKFFAGHGVTFMEMNEQYLDKIFDENKVNPVQQVFFIYHLFIFWIDLLDLENVEAAVTESMVPAIEYAQERMTEEL